MDHSLSANSTTIQSTHEIPGQTFSGRMAERSKALVLGTSHFGGAGSNPAPVIYTLYLDKTGQCSPFRGLIGTGQEMV